MRLQLLLATFAILLFGTHGQRAKKVFVHYLPWYDGAGVESPARTGWCYEYSASIDCSDLSIKHYMNEPLIGEYTLFDDDVLEYHFLLFVAAGIDGLIININPNNGIQTSGSLFILNKIVSFHSQNPAVDLKVIVSYDDGGSLADAQIDTAMQWVYDNIYDNPTYSSLIFKDDKLDVPVLIFWSESNVPYYYTKARELFSDDVFVIIRNPRLFDDSDGNMEWVNYLNTGLPKDNTAEWGEQHFNDFDWVMARQTENGYMSPNEVRMGNAYPGFDDENVAIFWHGGDNRYHLRDVDDGETMRLTWLKHINYQPNRLGGSDVVENPWIQLVTWNDWPEGTSIEPSTLDGYGYRALETCRSSIAEFKGTAPYDTECLEVPFDIYSARKSGDTSTADEMLNNLLQGNCVSSSPSPSPSISSSAPASISPTASISVSQAPTISSSVSSLPTESPSASTSLAPTASSSVSSTPVSSATTSITTTPIPSISASVSSSPSSSQSATLSPSTSISATPSVSVSESLSPTTSISNSISPSPATTNPTTPTSFSSTPSPSTSKLPSFSVMKSPTMTPSITASVTPSFSTSVTTSQITSNLVSVSPPFSSNFITSSATTTPSSSTMTGTPAVSLSIQPLPSSSPSATESSTAESVAPALITPSRSPAPSISPTATSSSSATATSSPSSTPSMTSSVSPSPSPKTIKELVQECGVGLRGNSLRQALRICRRSIKELRNGRFGDAWLREELRSMQ